MTAHGMSPAEYRARLQRLAASLLPELGQSMGEVVFGRWAAGQVGHMRDAKGEGRRSPADTGPLRIVTGDYARTTASGGIRRIATEGMRLRFSKGYALGETPQAYNETGTRYAPARPTLLPGLKDSLPGTTPLIRRRFTQYVRQSLWRAA